MNNEIRNFVVIIIKAGLLFLLSYIVVDAYQEAGIIAAINQIFGFIAGMIFVWFILSFFYSKAD